MEAESLWAMANLSIVLIGFSGVVGLLGQRADGIWKLEDFARLIAMLVAGFRGVLACIVPVILMHFELDMPHVWYVSSWCILLVSAFVGYFHVRFLRTIEEDEHYNRIASGTAYAMVIAIMLLNAAVVFDWPFSNAFGPYFLAVVLSFGVSCLYFVRLVHTELVPLARRPNKPGD